MKQAWRDTILFFSGLALLFHETVIHVGPERRGLLFVASAMLGLPLVLRGDERAALPPTSRPRHSRRRGSSGRSAQRGGTTR